MRDRILLAEFAQDARGMPPDWKPQLCWLETGDETWPWKTCVPGAIEPLLAKSKDDITVEVERRMQGDIAIISIYRVQETR